MSDFVGQLSIDNLGDKTFELKDSGRHELHMLTHKLNQMSQTLRSSVEDNGKLYRNLEVMNRTLEAQVAERTEDLLRLSMTDELTQLYNRRKLDQVISYEVERVKRNAEPLAVIIGDIDHFKQINDRYGHATGDRVLLAVAEVLRVNRRVADTVGRWGGEQFMIVCPHTDLAGAQLLADGMRQQIAQVEAGLETPVQISFGVAVLLPGESALDATARADAALYRAKANGRNRVETA